MKSSSPLRFAEAPARQGRRWKRETPIALTIGVFFMAAPVRGHDHSTARVPRQSSCPRPCGVRWPEKWCYGSCSAVGRVAGWCFTSAVPATGGIVYCGDICREKARTEQRRRANQRYQLDPEVRGDHCQRQREYRERCRLRRVTDHTSTGNGRSVKIEEPSKKTGMSTPLAEGFPVRPRFKRLQDAIRPVCILCGRGGHVGVKRIGPERRQ